MIVEVRVKIKAEKDRLKTEQSDDKRIKIWAAVDKEQTLEPRSCGEGVTEMAIYSQKQTLENFAYIRKYYNIKYWKSVYVMLYCV